MPSKKTSVEFGTQPAPTSQPDSVDVWRLLASLQPNERARLYMERRAFGMAKYTQPLLTFDGRDTVQDALEEALDLLAYTTKAILETDAGSCPLTSHLYLVKASYHARRSLSLLLNHQRDSSLDDEGANE